ncbi:hypothetical protein LSAT2_016936, partial [Lamellibrachia satsuma]
MRKCIMALGKIWLEADDFLKVPESFVLGPVVSPDLPVVVHKLPESIVGHLTCHGGGWSPQHISWTPLWSSQPRNVSRMGRGTVQISSQMITRGTYFCPMRSGAQSSASCGPSLVTRVC